MWKVLIAVLVFLIPVVSWGVDDVCTLDTGNWGPIATFSGTESCVGGVTTISDDDSFIVDAAETVTLIDDITFDDTEADTALEIDGALIADVANHGGDAIIINLGEGRTSPDAVVNTAFYLSSTGTLTVTSGCRQYGLVAPATQSAPCRDATAVEWFVDRAEPCGDITSCGTGASAELLRLHFTDALNDATGGQYTDEAISEIVATEDLVQFFDPVVDDEDYPPEAPHAYTIDAVDHSPTAYYIDINIAQDADLGDADIGYPQVQREFLELVASGDWPRGSTCIEVDDIGDTMETIVAPGISAANPAVVTITGHSFLDGDEVHIEGITESSDMRALNEGEYIVANAAANTFELTGESTLGFDAWTAGGEVRREDDRGRFAQWLWHEDEHNPTRITYTRPQRDCLGAVAAVDAVHFSKLNPLPYDIADNDDMAVGVIGVRKGDPFWVMVPVVLRNGTATVNDGRLTLTDGTYTINGMLVDATQRIDIDGATAADTVNQLHIRRCGYGGASCLLLSDTSLTIRDSTMVAVDATDSVTHGIAFTDPATLPMVDIADFGFRYIGDDTIVADIGVFPAVSSISAERIKSEYISNLAVSADVIDFANGEPTYVTINNIFSADGHNTYMVRNPTLATVGVAGRVFTRLGHWGMHGGTFGIYNADGVVFKYALGVGSWGGAEVRQFGYSMDTLSLYDINNQSPVTDHLGTGDLPTLKNFYVDGFWTASGSILDPTGDSVIENGILWDVYTSIDCDLTITSILQYTFTDPTIMTTLSDVTIGWSEDVDVCYQQVAREESGGDLEDAINFGNLLIKRMNTDRAATSISMNMPADVVPNFTGENFCIEYPIVNGGANVGRDVVSGTQGDYTNLVRGRRYPLTPDHRVPAGSYAHRQGCGAKIGAEAPGIWKARRMGFIYGSMGIDATNLGALYPYRPRAY